MVQGTTSDAGKSTLVAGLCRVLARRKVKVAPFKPQNMALNSAVTQDGGEIGRAQAVQALACGLDAHTDMNPVLIKPNSDVGAQIIIHGKALSNMDAAVFHDYKPQAHKAVLESYQRLQHRYDTIIVEGAGSPAEINLREGDIANMGFAEAVDCPVILIADIDKGGVFAHIVGTLSLLAESEQNRIIGFVINRFRGDIALLQPGLDWLQTRTGKPVLGVLPYLKNFYLEAEDAISTEQQFDGTNDSADNKFTGHAEDPPRSPTPHLNIVVPVLPRISNHTDFDALRLHPQVNLQFVPIEAPPPPCDLIILPGTKNVCGDLQSLIQYHWQDHINKHLRYGGKLIGICGGYQMLGETLKDPLQIEGNIREQKGFNLLPVETTLCAQKRLANLNGVLQLNGETAILRGYEIHAGTTQYSSSQYPIQAPPIRYSKQQSDGHLCDNDQVLGCYLHGLFDTPEALSLVLRWAGLQHSRHKVDIHALHNAQIDRLADCLETQLDFEKLHRAIATL